MFSDECELARIIEQSLINEGLLQQSNAVKHPTITQAIGVSLRNVRVVVCTFTIPINIKSRFASATCFDLRLSPPEAVSNGE